MIWFVASMAFAGVIASSNEALEAGQPDQAIAVIEESLSESQGSAGLYANLSHAYYAKNDLPRAIGAMRKASALAPRSSSIQHDLARMRSLHKGATAPVDDPIWWSKLLTIGEAGTLASFSLLLASVWLVRRRQRPDGLAVVTYLGCLFLSLYIFLGVRERAAHPVVVVVDHPVTLRDGPAMSAGLRHELQPGSEVVIEQQYDGFALITDGRGRRGWAALTALWTP